jgi:hypothetical protein
MQYTTFRRSLRNKLGLWKTPKYTRLTRHDYPSDHEVDSLNVLIYKNFDEKMAINITVEELAAAGLVWKSK